jgi:hypothetical protein
MTIIQRPVKGARISSFYPVHELPPIASLDSAFQLQEYISLLIRSNVHDVETIVSIPGKSDSYERDSSDNSEKEPGEKEGKNEVAVEEACWIYEQLRYVSHKQFAVSSRLKACLRWQTSRPRPLASSYYHPAARMHSPDVSGDEGRRMVVPVRSPRQ